MTESREIWFSDTSEISLCVIKSNSVSSGQPPPGACLAALCSRDRRNGFGWTRLNRRFEGVGVMRNVNRTIRASAKDVIANLASPPQWIEPELCKLVTRIPAGDNWAHEIKFDGPDCQWRCGAANAADRRRDVRSAASRRRGFDAAAAARTQGAAVSAELISSNSRLLQRQLCAENRGY